MPSVKQKSGLVQKYGQRFLQAAEEHREDEVEFSGFSDLPPNINNGVAKLTKCWFGQFENGDNAGEYFFMAQGTVLEPLEAQDYDLEGNATSTVRTFGATTKIGPEPVCDTPNAKGQRKTMADHLKWVQNEMKKLGASPDSLTGDALEQTAAALTEAQPTFRFRTWRGKKSAQFPNPRTNHSWEGLIDYDESSSPAAAELVRDDSAPGGNGVAAAPAGRAAAVDSDPDGALAELVARATAQEQDAIDSLTAIALEAGVSQEEVDGAGDWQEVYDLLTSRTAGGEEPEATEEGPPPDPAKGDIVGYRPLDPRTKKPVKRPISCEIVFADRKSKTVTLKRLDDNKLIAKVKWDSLEPTP
jgi:hypothetical protein